MEATLENSAVAKEQEKVSFHSNPKQCSNYHTAALISHASKVILKILQCFWGFNSMWTEKFQIFKLDLERQRSQRSNCQHLLDHWKSKRVPEKHLFLLLLTMPKPLTMWISTNYRKFWKRWAYQNTWPASWEICMQVKKQQLELNMEQQTGSK